MRQTATSTHEIFDRNEVVDVVTEVFQGDKGANEIVVQLTKDRANLDLTGYDLTLTNLAPNGMIQTYLPGADSPISLEGNSLKWVLGEFDAAQVGTYIAQARLVSESQTVTVVFIKYNVERSVTGRWGEVQTQYPAMEKLITDVESLAAQVKEMGKSYEAFKKILEDKSLTWDTLVGKPETFPPSAHSHTEFTTLANEIMVISNAQKGMVKEIYNGSVTIPTTAWVKNNVNLRYEATITHEKITAETDVKFQFEDSQNGKYRMNFLRPATGYVKAYTDSIPAEAITLAMAITEVVE